MKIENIHGLMFTPYKKRRPYLSNQERIKIIQVLGLVQHSAFMSDFAFLTAVYMFDKVMEGMSLNISHQG